MITVDLVRQSIDLRGLLALARREPVLVLTADGREYLLSEADDFDHEVAVLSNSHAFQQFLDERSRSPRSTSLDDLEHEIDRELAVHRTSDAA